MKKSSKAYKTIGEVAEILELDAIGNKKNTHTIRYWESEFKQIKPTIITGDFNVAHREIDIARPKPNYNKSAGYTQTEIDGFDNFISKGFVDIYREINPEEVKYSWWNYRFKSRERNVGWRIDYFMISSSLRNNVVNTEIHNEYFGSDHCPISLDLSF